MYTLGIETSCDETSAAIVENGQKILSCEVSSSIDFHKKYGGIVPEIASRMQLETIVPVTESALKAAGIKLKQVGLISMTNEPGLLGSLLVGISFARALSLSLKIPLIEVNHLYAHIYAGFLNRARIKFPFIGLIVSGGHTSLYRVDNFVKIKLLGQTNDDACGEAFDKVAKILGLSYPGGPYIEKLAKKGNPRKIKFGCSNTNKPLDFSFSGIKTAVMYYVKGEASRRHCERLRGEAEAGAKQSKNRDCFVAGACTERSECAPRNYKLLPKDIAASFQEAAIDALVRKSVLACNKYRINRLVIGGGVAANNHLREEFTQAEIDYGLRVYFPAKELCMDNAAMVAGLGWYLYKKGRDNKYA